MTVPPTLLPGDSQPRASEGGRSDRRGWFAAAAPLTGVGSPVVEGGGPRTHRWRPGTVGPRVRRSALALVVVLAIGLYAISDDPAVDAVCYLGVLVGAAAGAWVGAERASPGVRLVPRLVAAGLTLNALGDVAWTVVDLRGGDTDVSVADPLWFASYVLLCLALWAAHRRTHGARVGADSAVDAATIVVVSLLVFWSLSIDDIVQDHTVTPLERVVLASYPVADAFLIALALRVLVNREARAAIGAAFAAGLCLWLAADVAYLHVSASGTLTILMDSAWMVAPVLMARAAWSVSDGRGGAPSATRSNWVVQMSIAVGPLIVPPALELTADLRGEPDQPVQLLAGTAALIALALVRTAGLIRSEEHARRELEVARDVAHEASRAKSMFLANVSHELRTPLTAMLATAELLEDTATDPLHVTLLLRMRRSGQRLKDLIEQVLDFSRIEAGQLVLTPAPFDPHALVAEAVQGYAPRASSAGLGFEWHVDPAVPHRVVGDAGRLHQVLTNLVDNALKFTAEGQVTVTVRPATGDGGPEAGGELELVVSDTGIGIGEDDQESVFESFQQVDGSATRQYGGAGLGLAICQELTALMGGTLTLHSRLGEGATFVLRVPLPAADVTWGRPARRSGPLSRARTGR